MRAVVYSALLLGACAAPRERPLNPVYDRDGGTVQVRPFYWKRTDERGRRVNILGPLVRWRDDHVYRSLQVFPAFYYTARHAPQAERSWFAMFFPLVFLGSDDFLVLPFGGYSRGLLGLHHLLMVTPLYIRTRTVSSHPTDPVTYTVRHILFPFIAWGSDGRPGGRRKLRIAPFYGRKLGRKGEVSGFYFWPFYTFRRSENSRAFFVFPFYGRSETPTRRHKTILFPFYQRSEDLLTGATDVSLWPFWRRAKGSDGLEVRRAWPLAEYRRAGFTTVEYVAWPFWRRSYVDSEREFARWTWITPFYRSVVGVSRPEGKVRRKTVLWPLGRWERTRDGGREVAVPVLSPVDAPALREFAEPFRPFISLYHRRRAPDGDQETTALFGLYMSRRTGETRKTNLAGGLVGWGRHEGRRYLRLLFWLRLKF